MFLLVAGVAGAAAFAHRAGAPGDPSFAAPFAQPASHGDSSTVLRIAPIPAPAPPVIERPVTVPPLRLVTPVHRLTPRHVVPVPVTAHPARPARTTPVAPVAAPAPTPPPTPAPAPAPAPAPTVPAAEVPPVPPVVTTPTAHDNGNGKDKGKAKGKNKKDDVQVTPVAETIAPVAPATTTEVVVPVVPTEDDQHGRGHDKDK